MGDSAYAKIKYLEVQNFMSFEYAKVEFDEENILNIKGYNDSGKSNILRAFAVIMYDAFSTQQVKLIRDGQTYFRIVMTFEDGVSVLKDKYSDGQGLYEMYKDGKVLYSTKQNGVYTKIRGVPEPIAQYMGVLTGAGTNINCRSNTDKLLAVETSGSENYKMFNDVLHSEEIARACEFLKNDKNELFARKSRVEAEVSVLRDELKTISLVTEDIVNVMKQIDKNIDNKNERVRNIKSIASIDENVKSIPDLPKLNKISTERLDILNRMSSALRGSKIEISPELPKIDSTRLDMLSEMKECFSNLRGIKELPKLSSVSQEGINYLNRMSKLLADIKNVDNSTLELDNSIKSLTEEKSQLEQKLREEGIRLVTCPNCNNLVEVQDGE